jgi:hypothetical protein
MRSHPKYVNLMLKSCYFDKIASNGNVMGKDNIKSPVSLII